MFVKPIRLILAATALFIAAAGSSVAINPDAPRIVQAGWLIDKLELYRRASRGQEPNAEENVSEGLLQKRQFNYDGIVFCDYDFP